MTSGIIVSLIVFILLGIISYLGAKYTVQFGSTEAIIGLYVLFLTVAQFFAAKFATFDFGFGLSWVAPVGVITFPFTLQLTDMLNERFGRKQVYKMIAIGFVSQVTMVILLLLAIYIPNIGNAVDPLAGFAPVPRITIASWIAFLISESFDAWIYDKLRSILKSVEKAPGDWWKWLWVRNVFSDILSLGLDSLIFVPLAFFTGFSDLEFIIQVIIGQLVTKWILGVIDTPFMYLTRWVYEKHNGSHAM